MEKKTRAARTEKAEQAKTSHKKSVAAAKSQKEEKSIKPTHTTAIHKVSTSKETEPKVVEPMVQEMLTTVSSPSTQDRDDATQHTSEIEPVGTARAIEPIITEDDVILPYAPSSAF